MLRIYESARLMAELMVMRKKRISINDKNVDRILGDIFYRSSILFPQYFFNLKFVVVAFK